LFAVAFKIVRYRSLVRQQKHDAAAEGSQKCVAFLEHQKSHRFLIAPHPIKKRSFLGVPEASLLSTRRGSLFRFDVLFLMCFCIIGAELFKRNLFPFHSHKFYKYFRHIQ
jgi:hypothetical protein